MEAKIIAQNIFEKDMVHASHLKSGLYTKCFLLPDIGK